MGEEKDVIKQVDDLINMMLSLAPTNNRITLIHSQQIISERSE